MRNNDDNKPPTEGLGLSEVRRVSDSEISENEILEFVRIDSSPKDIMPLEKISDETADIDFEIELDPIYQINGSDLCSTTPDIVLPDAGVLFNVDIAGSLDLSEGDRAKDATNGLSDDDVMISLADFDTATEYDFSELQADDIPLDGDADNDLLSIDILP